MYLCEHERVRSGEHGTKGLVMGKDVSTTIRSIIKTLSDLHDVVQHEDANQATEVILQRTTSVPRNHLDPVFLIFKIQNTLRQLKSNITDVRRLQLDVQTQLDKQLASLLEMTKPTKTSGTLDMSLVEVELEVILNTSLDFKRMFQVLPERRKKKKASPYLQDESGSNLGRDIDWIPSIHANEENLKRLAFFREVEDKFDKLSTELKICLLSFAVFPENHEVNRTMLMYWWIGEGILPDKGTPEDAVKEILEEFTKLKLIEPIENNRKVEPTSYRMFLFVHCSVVLISKELGLFDMYHIGQKPRMRKSELKKVCLVKGSSSQEEAKANKMAALHDVETVFNVSERFPDFIFNWFSSMKELKVLSLGRWERTEGEIEVDSYGLMNDLSSMKKLRFLSFQGISTITSISGFACKLPRLIILDLRGCYNLEKLPEEIGYLNSLVYLDLTGCDALEGIPMRLSFLEKLEVIKGFVVTSEREIACKLIHLKRLPKLRKLGVTVDRSNFGLDELLTAIYGFRALEKLKVLWKTVKPLSKKQPKRSTERTLSLPPVLSLPSTLTKLGLQRFPDKKLPNWLQPQNLGNLEKLHLGSSRHLKAFSDSLPEIPSECNVKVLRLTCLHSLKVDWLELTDLYFPKLSFLEVYECPRFAFCPCDRDGIWRAEEDSKTTL